jgi:hypothetical protein
MQIHAFLTDPPVVSKILLHLDQSSGFDAAEVEPVPNLVFDQSLPEEFGG